MAHLLIVEDDDLLRDGLGALLGADGHVVTLTSSGAIALQVLDTARFDGVVLDLGLPEVDGLQVLRWIREHMGALPVLVLTARDSIEDRVAGLQAGADDYLTKPFSPQELSARIGAMLRRAQFPAYAAAPMRAGSWLTPVAASGARLRIDTEQPRAWVDERVLELTQREWMLLRLLFEQAGRVVGRDEVMQRWNDDPEAPREPSESSSNALEVYVHRLRRKLADSGVVIRNVRGLGYLLEGV